MPNTRKFLAATPTNLDAFVTAPSILPPGKPPWPSKCTRAVRRKPPTSPSHVHDIAVTVRDGPNTSRFRVFFKRHVLLPASKSLRIQGDLLVMRVASRNEHSVVNMRAGDCRLSAFVTRKIAKHIRKFQKPQRARMPRHVKLERRW
ncbi:hypothetical protein B0H14DRAFT_3481596 [Mycena olivaceomarginata]|nr:hypothetical protein B0H14DRAFT_3481596 [Mycena olivaceomarginata]